MLAKNLQHLFSIINLGKIPKRFGFFMMIDAERKWEHDAAIT
jgi:hypothetical protein